MLSLPLAGGGAAPAQRGHTRRAEVRRTPRAAAAAAPQEEKPRTQRFTGTVRATLAFLHRLEKLQESRAARDAENSVLLVGEALLREVAAEVPGLHVKSLLVSDRLVISPLADVYPSTALFSATPEKLGRVAGLTTADSLTCVAEVASPAVRLLSFVTASPLSLGDDALAALRALPRVLVLDGVQDPGNVGTLLRCALAFRFGGCVLLPGCADPLGPKALRAGRGAAFRLPLWRAAADGGGGSGGSGSGSGVSVLSFAAEQCGATLLGADPTASASASRAALAAAAAAGGRRPVWLVLGAEGPGLSRSARGACAALVRVPRASGMESINVAAAGAVLMAALALEEEEEEEEGGAKGGVGEEEDTEALRDRA